MNADPLTFNVIDCFYDRTAGVHTPLSNFYPSPVTIAEFTYPTVEHAFQASKTLDWGEKQSVARAETPGAAKKLGRHVTLRGDWEAVKIRVMLECLRLKFQDSVLARWLLDTGNALLIEGNDWGDRFWGQVNGQGENWLGFLLMGVRAELRSREQYVESGMR